MTSAKAEDMVGYELNFFLASFWNNPNISIIKHN